MYPLRTASLLRASVDGNEEKHVDSQQRRSRAMQHAALILPTVPDGTQGPLGYLPGGFLYMPPSNLAGSDIPRPIT